MAPYFNSETGALHDESADDHVADHVAPTPDERKPSETKLVSEPPHVIVSDPLVARDELEKMLADPTHPAWDPSHPQHEIAQKRYLEFVMLERGANPLDPEQNRALLEVHPGGRSRLPGSEALSPAPRPVLPEGNAWDERALVLGESEAHAVGLPPHTVMQVTDDLAAVIETGVEYSAELGEAELLRRHGREGAERMADRARQAFQIIVESEAPLLVQRVRELGRDYGNDPGVIAIFANLYDEIRSAPPSDRLLALLERREHRLAQVDAAAHARRAKAQQAEEAEATAVSDDALGQIGAQHRRWQSRP